MAHTKEETHEARVALLAIGIVAADGEAGLLADAHLRHGLVPA